MTKKKRAKKDTKKWYYTSYPVFVKYFEEEKPLTKDDIIMGIAMVYSWMPTIPVTTEALMKEQGNEVVECVKDLIEGKFDEETIEKLKEYINNSLPGTSKLLHFIRPDMYPLWDSQICKIITNSKYAVGSIKKYIKYKENCDSLIAKNDKMEIINNAVKEYMQKNWISIDYEGWKNYRKIDVYLLECKKQGDKHWKEIQELLCKGIKK